MLKSIYLKKYLDGKSMVFMFQTYAHKENLMARPKKDRLVNNPPLFSEFKPSGVPTRSLAKVCLNIDEYEAIRLADYLGMDQATAANEMEISRPTFARLIVEARKKISDFIINGKFLAISGGNIHFHENVIKCHNCGHMFKINFENSITECPACNSANLIDLAGGFGHGKCCRNRGKNHK